MSANEFFSSASDMLKAGDLKGRDVEVEIESYEIKDFDDQSKMILSFKGKDKKLALNKTNGRTIAAGLGDNIDSWKGKKIILFEATTDFGGKIVPCIRVRMLPKESVGDDDIPF